MNDQSSLKGNSPAEAKRLASQAASVRARLAADPSVYHFDTPHAELFAVGDFMSADECARMIAMVDRVAKPSATFDTPYSANYRTSYSGDVNHRDPFVRKISRRIDDLLGIPSEFGEAVQGQRYLQGQEFQAHCDFFYTDAAYWQHEKDRGGQRSWTAMVFLNDVERGGETHFPHLQMAMTPRTGALLGWNNMNREGQPNTWTTHAAKPVEAGVKYVITKWYRAKVWE